MSLFAAFALLWPLLVGAFVVALLLGYRLPLGPRRSDDRRRRALTLLDDTSIEA